MNTVQHTYGPMPVIECDEYIYDRSKGNIYAFIRVYEFEKKYGIPDMFFIDEVPCFDFSACQYDEQILQQKQKLIEEYLQSSGPFDPTQMAR